MRYSPLKKTSYLSCILPIITAICLLAGCSWYQTAQQTTKNLIRDFNAAEDGLNKVVGVIPFENRTRYSTQAIDDSFNTVFLNTIAQTCPSLILVLPDQTPEPDRLQAPPRNSVGLIDNLALALLGRQGGYNAFITGGMVTLETIEAETGMLWFKDTQNRVRIRMSISIYDTRTGAKMADNTLMREVDVDQTLFEQIKEGKIDHIDPIDSLLTELGSEMGDQVCDTLTAQPWSGFVKAVDDIAITISSGSQSGLKIGDRLNLYDEGQLIQGVDGIGFLVPGQKIGEVEITEVGPQQSEAICLTDVVPIPGQVVQMPN